MDKVLGFLIFMVILYGIYNAQRSDKKSDMRTEKYCSVCKKETQTLEHLKKELSSMGSTSYKKAYIIDVIDHGSDSLGFRGGVMEGGFATHEDAEKIACYVLSLSGESCAHAYPKDAAMFYTSICGGCHGDDGRGLGGNYPNLTRKKLLGLERREESLRVRIKKLERLSEKHLK